MVTKSSNAAFLVPIPSLSKTAAFSINFSPKLCCIFPVPSPPSSFFFLTQNLSVFFYSGLFVYIQSTAETADSTWTSKNNACGHNAMLERKKYQKSKYKNSWLVGEQKKSKKKNREIGAFFSDMYFLNAMAWLRSVLFLAKFFFLLASLILKCLTCSSTLHYLWNFF